MLHDYVGAHDRRMRDRPMRMASVAVAVAACLRRRGGSAKESDREWANPKHVPHVPDNEASRAIGHSPYGIFIFPHAASRESAVR